MKTGTRIAFALLCLLPSLGIASPGNVGVGMEGTPNGATPALRIGLGETTALNFTAPLFVFANNSGNKSWDAGLGAAILPWQRGVGSLRHGPRFGVTTNISYNNPEFGPSRTSSDWGVNAGWDLEYFVALIPGLSVGGNVAVGYAFSWSENPGGPAYYRHEFATRGNNLNLRYYF